MQLLPPPNVNHRKHVIPCQQTGAAPVVLGYLLGCLGQGQYLRASASQVVGRVLADGA